MRVTRITLFAPRIFLQVSVLFWTILYPSSEPSSELNLSRTPFCYPYSLFCSVPFRSDFLSKFRTKSLQNQISSRTPFCYPYSLFKSLFCSVLNFPIQVQNQIPPEPNLFQNTPFLLSLFFS